MRRLPHNAGAFRALPPSYQETLLPLRDPRAVEDLAQQLQKAPISCRELRQLVANRLASRPKLSGRGRPRTPTILKKLGRCTALLPSTPNGSWFTKDEAAELDSTQKAAALSSAESLMEKLRHLKNRLEPGKRHASP